MALKEFAVPMTLLLIALLVYLLLIGRLGGAAFTTALLGVLALGAAGAIVLPRTEDVTEVGMKAQGAELLVKMERARAEVFAKAETVRGMAETIAEIGAYSLSRVGRLSGEGLDLDVSLLRSRGRLEEMLAKVGTSEPRAREITRHITEAILFDLSAAVWGEVREALRETNPNILAGTKDARARVTEQLRNSGVGEAAKVVRGSLEELKAWTPKVQQRIAEFDEFRRSGRLPAPAPASGRALGTLQ